MNVGQDVATFTDVIVNDLYKMYTKMTVKCFKGPYSYQTHLYYYMELPESWGVGTPTSQILRCPDTHATDGGCAYAIE